MTRVLLVVFDGLRPDMIRPDTTPNLVRFASMAARLPRARSVFPSETRVCTASIATGCHPRRHGLVANQMIHPADPQALLDTSDAAALRAAERAMGGKVIERPGLSDLLAEGGKAWCVFSSGSTGQTFVLAPRAAELGQVVVSGHGPAESSPAAQALFDRLPDPPHEAAPRAVWIADAWRQTMMADPPDASVLWLCEPDTSAHYDGLASDGQNAALRGADAAFGRILDAWQDGPWREELQILVASDHGHVTVTNLLDVRARIAESGLIEGCVCTSDGLSVPPGEAARIGPIAEFLMRQEWIGHVFVADSDETPQGALPHAAVLADHARTASILFTLRGAAAPGAGGLLGTTPIDRAHGLEPGAGTHGGLLEGEMGTVLMLAGSRVCAGTVSSLPAGLPDIAPTILHLVGVPGGAGMDGRVLAEVLADEPAPPDPHGYESWEACGGNFGQRVARVRMGRHVWIDHGLRTG